MTRKRFYVVQQVDDTRDCSYIRFESENGMIWYIPTTVPVELRDEHFEKIKNEEFARMEEWSKSEDGRYFRENYDKQLT